MEQRFSLEAAGKLMGITANAMRARAKKNPDKYKMQRDNNGKIWLLIDPDAIQRSKPSKSKIEGSTNDELKASIEGLLLKIEAASNEADLKTQILKLEARILELEAEKNGSDALLSERMKYIDKQDALLDQKQKQIDTLLWNTQRSWWQRLFGKNNGEKMYK